MSATRSTPKAAPQGAASDLDKRNAAGAAFAVEDLKLPLPALPEPFVESTETGYALHRAPEVLRFGADCYRLALAQTEQAAPRMGATDWTTPTTFVQRFGDALQLLCAGKRPPEAVIAAWMDDDADDLQLQNFCASNGPAWAQGIGLIDAAHVAASQPTEGVDHEHHGNAEDAYAAQADTLNCPACGGSGHADDVTMQHVTRHNLRNLVDVVWNHVTESEQVPSTETADSLIDRAGFVRQA